MKLEQIDSLTYKITTENGSFWTRHHMKVVGCCYVMSGKGLTFKDLYALEPGDKECFPWATHRICGMGNNYQKDPMFTTLPCCIKSKSSLWVADSEVETERNIWKLSKIWLNKQNEFNDFVIHDENFEKAEELLNQGLASVKLKKYYGTNPRTAAFLLKHGMSPANIYYDDIKKDTFRIAKINSLG